MLCQSCQQREAKVQITKTVNGKTQELYLCEHCAQQAQDMNFLINPGIIPDFLQALFGFTPSTQNPTKNQNQNHNQLKEEACPQCGMTFSKITQAGKLGCSSCYQTFGSQLEPLLRRIHGGGQHVGKIPSRRGKALREKAEIQKLKEKLKQLVLKEEFEAAALVRDQIREFEQTKGGDD